MRKLASIQRIKKLNPLPQFDNLLLAEILGWRCIVKKMNLKSFKVINPEFLVKFG